MPRTDAPSGEEPRALTPLDGSLLERTREDFATTLRIRRALLAEERLSLAAKSVKIVTASGKVTLRGPVADPAERRTIETIARTIAGQDQVQSRLGAS